MDRTAVTYVVTIVCWAAGMVVGVMLRKSKNSNVHIAGQMILTIFTSLAVVIAGLFTAGMLSLEYRIRANLYSILVLLSFGALLFMLLGFVWTEGARKKFVVIFLCIALACTAVFGGVRIYDAYSEAGEQQEEFMG